MNKVIFSERQSFRQIKWLWWIIIPVAFFSTLSILYGFYQQVILGEPWGKESVSNEAVITMLLLVIFAQVLVIWIVSSIELKIEITGNEFRYKFFAHFNSWKVLTPHQITDYSFEKYTFWKGRGLGYRKDLFKKTVRMIIKPDYILSVRTNDGGTIMISTEKKDELSRALQKLMSKSENF